jgi:biopolymer transport protein ExbB/TolQ
MTISDTESTPRRLPVGWLARLRTLKGTDFQSLGLAAAIALVAYLPISALFTLCRAAEVRSAVEGLAPAAADVKQAVEKDRSVAAAGGKRAIFDIGKIEERARAIRGAVKKNAENEDEEARKEQAGDEKAQARQAAIEQANDRLRPGLAAKLFGWEQFFCYALTLWVALLLRDRWRALTVEEGQLVKDFSGLPEGEVVLDHETHRLEDVKGEIINSDPQLSSHTGRLLMRAVNRFAVAKDVAAAEEVVRSECDAIAQDYDTSLGMVRYVIWAVPSIGFIGTVRGMGLALAQADSPENLPAVVGWLGVAFDTTLVALFLSIGLMFLTHQFQRRYERFVLGLARKCEVDLLHHLAVRRLPAAKAEADGTPAKHR